MDLHFIEASNGPDGPNWGKFAVGHHASEEWGRRSALPGYTHMPLLTQLGAGYSDLWVLDLQTGEGARFRIDRHWDEQLRAHRIHVCVMFEAFLGWLMDKALAAGADHPARVGGWFRTLPGFVELPHCPPGMYGYRRGEGRA
jgi:hypothetical protein